MRKDSGKVDSDRHVVLVDLNALLDTRLGTIALFDESVALRLSTDPKYINRHYDHFEELVNDPEFKHADYVETYKKANEMTLSMSRPTQMFVQLYAIMAGYVADCIENQDKNYVDLHVNISPYNDLSKETIAEILAAVSVGMHDDINIKHVSLPINVLSPEYLKDNYTHWITYDYNEWFDMHFGSKEKLSDKELMNWPMPRFTIYTPMRFKSKESYQDYLDAMKADPENANLLNPFVNAYFLMHTFVGIEFREISEFSILSPAAATE